MARKTIEQRIALDGGKEILDTLKSLGKEGEAAFAQIQEAAKKAGSPGAALSKSIADLRKNMRDLGAAGARVGNDFRNLGRSVSNFGSSVATVGKRLLGTVAAVTALGVGLVKFTQAGTQAADAAGKQAASLGLAVDAYGRLQFAAEQSGASAETFSTAITRLNVNLAEAAKGNKTALDQFDQLGVSIKNAAGEIRPTEELLGDLAESFSRLPDGAQKSALAVRLFGRSGADLIPFLNEGRAGIAALGAEAEKLGIIFSAEQVRISTVLNDSLSALKRAASGLRNEIGILFAPSITKVSEALTAAIVDNRKAIIDLADNAIAKAIPLVEDFIAAIQGRDVDVQNLWVIEARDAIIRFADSARAAIVGIVIPAYEALIAAGERVAAALNGVFGTEFTGQQVLIAGAILKLVGVFGVLASGLGVVLAAAKLVVSSLLLIGPASAAFSSLFAVIIAGAKLAAAGLAGLVGFPVLIVAGIAAAAAAIFIFWDEIVAAGSVAVNALSGLVRGFGRVFAAGFGGLANAARAAFDGVVAVAREALGVLVAVATGIATQIGAAFQAVVAIQSTIWNAVVAVIVGAFDRAASAARGFGEFVVSIWNAVQRGAQIAWNAVVGVVADAWTAVRRIVSEGLGNAFKGIVDASRSVWNFFRDAARSAINFAISLVSRLASAISRAAAAFRSLSASTGASQGGSTREGFATGGYVRGPGTGTSDSIMARLSDGEFVIKAKAVRKYGVGILSALNSMRLPAVPGFATGGLVNAPSFNASGLVDAMGAGMGFAMPRFAEGGMVAAPAGGGGRPINLSIDGQSFGMSADEDTAERLARFAARKQLASLGAKPKWYGR